jgi:uncharacterized paraquat-inducible protein A
MMIVSRESKTAGDVKGCSCCGAARDRAGQRYCRRCHRLYMRERRHGKVEVLLTPAELAAVLAARAV